MSDIYIYIFSKNRTNGWVNNLLKKKYLHVRNITIRHENLENNTIFSI